jgi:hypothetical protein
MEAIEYVSNRRNEELDRQEHDLKTILNILGQRQKSSHKPKSLADSTRGFTS